MRPGMTEIPDGLVPGTIVAIVDETHHKPLAVGEMKVSSEEMQKAESGKLVKNIHFVGDKIWKKSE